MVTTGFAEALAPRMSADHALLAARWFARLRDLLPVEAHEVFPSDRLLDHIPSLIVDISAYLKAPEEEAIVATTTVVEKARAESSVALGVCFLKPLLFARMTGDVDANAARLRSNRLHGGRVPAEGAAGRTSSRIMTIRRETFLTHLLSRQV